MPDTPKTMAWNCCVEAILGEAVGPDGMTMKIMPCR